MVLIIGVTIFLSACGSYTADLISAETFTLPASRPPSTATLTSTFTATPTITDSPIPTATWVQQGPQQVIVPIILYHRIDISPINSQYYVPPENFERQMQLLRDWEYKTITTEMLANAIRDGANLPPRPIIITFDDGHLDNYTQAFPIMQKYGLTAVVYIVGNYLGTDGYMNAEQVREMATAGWEVGSHGMSHSELTKLDPQVLRHEVVDSRKTLEKKIGVPVLTFAYQFGMSNASVLDYTYFAGYIAGMGLGPTHNQTTKNLYYLQRREIKGSYDLIAFSSYLPWQGDAVFLPTFTPTPSSTPSRTPLPTVTKNP